MNRAYGTLRSGLHYVTPMNRGLTIWERAYRLLKLSDQNNGKYKRVVSNGSIEKENKPEISNGRLEQENKPEGLKWKIRTRE